MHDLTREEAVDIIAKLKVSDTENGSPGYDIWVFPEPDNELEKELDAIEDEGDVEGCRLRYEIKLEQKRKFELKEKEKTLMVEKQEREELKRLQDKYRK